MTALTAGKITPGQPAVHATGWVRAREWLLVTFSLSVIVLLLWLPFGFRTTGLMEEWMIIHDWNMGGQSAQGQDVGWFITTGTLTMRPLTAVSFLLAHELVPDSFAGFNVMMLVMFILKGLLAYAILRLLTRRLVFAYVVAVLFIIFPADSALFTFRAFNCHVAVIAYLAAVLALLHFWLRPRLWLLPAMWGGLVLALWTYEAAYPLVLLTPALLWWWTGRLSHRLVQVSVLWMLAPGATFLYVLVQFTQGDTYQSWVLQRSGLSNGGAGVEISKALWLAYRRHFVDGFAAGVTAFDPGRALTWVGMFIGVLAAAAGLGLHHFSSDDEPGSWPVRRWISLFAIGLAIIGLGYILYMLTPYRQLTWRVYYYSHLGGAICVAILARGLVRLVRRGWPTYSVISGVLIAIAGVRALESHAVFVDLSNNQQELLRDIAQQIPQLVDPANSTLVVVDETGRYWSNWSLGASYLLEEALRIVYDDYRIRAVLCSFDPEAGTFRTLPELHETCSWTEERIVVNQDGQPVRVVPYENAVVIRFTDAGGELLERLPDQYAQNGGRYAPDPLIASDAPLPRRVSTLFSIGLDERPRPVRIAPPE